MTRPEYVGDEPVMHTPSRHKVLRWAANGKVEKFTPYGQNLRDYRFNVPDHPETAGRLIRVARSLIRAGVFVIEPFGELRYLHVAVPTEKGRQVLAEWDAHGVGECFGLEID